MAQMSATVRTTRFSLLDMLLSCLAVDAAALDVDWRHLALWLSLITRKMVQSTTIEKQISEGRVKEAKSVIDSTWRLYSVQLKTSPERFVTGEWTYFSCIVT